MSSIAVACAECGLSHRRGARWCFWAKVQKTDGCWLWTGSIQTTGYGKYGKGRYAHRISYVMHLGPIPAGQYVCHRCDNPLCVRPEHFFLGTLADNIRDMHQKGRSVFQAHPERRPRGERTNTAKLTANRVQQIRGRRGETVGVVASDFGVTKSTIKAIWSGRNWKHLPEVA